MKKLSILFLSIFLLSGGIAFAGYSEPTYLEAHKDNNTAYNQKEAYREIELVRYSAQNLPAIASGDAVVWDTVSDDGVTVRLTTTSSDGAFAGIACTAIQTSDSTTSQSFSDDAGRRNWGYIVCHGPAIAKVTAGGQSGALTGDAFYTSSDSGAVTTWGGASTTDTGLLGKRAKSAGGFFFNDSDGTSTSVKVFVKNK